MTKGAERRRVRKLFGIRRTRGKQPIRRWVLCLKDNPDRELNNLGYGLEFGIRTGRLFCWSRGEDMLKFLGYPAWTSGQTCDWFADALCIQRELIMTDGVELSTSTATEALRLALRKRSA